MPQVQREYRDRLFVKIFSDKTRLLSLYNAVNGTNHASADDMEVNTIEDVIYVTMRNDVSFVFQGFLSLYEQQSTFNPNMPLRGFLYFSRLYQRYADDSRIYGSRLLKIPSPRFFVFYNGAREQEDRVTLRLSEMFEVEIPPGEFEWTATMLNINGGRNKDLMERCKDLQDYSTYVKIVEESKKKHADVKEAVCAAVDEAIRLNLLGGYFRKCREEAILDVLTEFDEVSYKKVIYEDGVADGYEQGIEQGRAEAQTRIAEAQAEIAALKAENARLKALR